MTMRVERRGHPLLILAMIAVLLLGMIGFAPASAAAQPIPAPTIGEVEVDSFDCETGGFGVSRRGHEPSTRR